MRRPLIIGAAVVATALALGACGGSSKSGATGATSAGGNTTVVLKSLTFEPDSITVKTGDKVTWDWQDTQAHNVTFPSFHSDTQSSGTYAHTFTSTGTFKYHCTLHPTMTGKVKVTSA